MGKINKTIDSQFLVRVIKNEVSPEEKEYFESWLNESNKNKEYFGDFLLLWEKMDRVDVPEPPDTAKQWNEISNLISEEKPNKNEELTQSQTVGAAQPPKVYKMKYDKKKPASVSSIGVWFVRIAAVILVAVGLHFFLDNTSQQVPVSGNKKVATQQTYERVTAKGERATVPLADGTVVYLNADSKLIYPRYFLGNERKVELKGEAYFVVVSDKHRPFRVFVNKTITEVVGTEFNIRYRNDKLSVVVTKGVINAYEENSEEKIRVEKGEIVGFENEGGFSSPEKVDVNEHIAWRKNKLAFRNTSLEEVLKEIEIFYNVAAQLENEKVKNRRLTGIFSTDSLDEVLAAVSISLDVEITRKGRNIIVK